MSQFRRDLLRAIEAGIAGLFLIQAVRFVYATVYAHASSADLLQRTTNPDAQNAPGAVELATVQTEIVALVALLLLPVLALIISRWRISFTLAVILVAVGRSLALQIADLEVAGGGLVVGSGLLYLALTVIRRPANFPVMLLVGFSAEQVIRALGNTYDYTWRSGYMLDVAGLFEIEMDLLVGLVSIGAILLSIWLWFDERLEAKQRARQDQAPPPRGQLNMWGGLALGGLLFLEFTLLALPNAVARWAETDYAGIVPWLIAATALPLVPEVRNQARRFAGMFDGAWRGWLWMLLLGLLLVVGRQYHGILAGIALVFAQFLASLTLWWFVQTGQPRRNITGLAVLVSVISFVALAIGDYFTYDYAYVRDISDPTYQNIDDVLRSFRDMGLGLALVAALMLSIPMILARRWIPWRGGRTVYTLLIALVILGTSFIGVITASDSAVRRPDTPDCLRVMTLNIHGGYSQFFEPNLDAVAELAELNGADILLLQEVDTGRMASFGVDQVLWLARRLNMESAFFPQNEALQGLAVLSRVPITGVEGLGLPSEGNQAAVLHVSLAPERLVSDPQAPDSDLHIYNAWLGLRIAERDGRPIPESEQDQTRQLNRMLSWITARHSPDERIILGGTFNFDENSSLYRMLSQMGLQDPFAGRLEVDTVYLVDGITERYDYLWMYQLPLSGTMVDRSPEARRTSDHRPIVVEFKRRKAREGEPELTCP